MTIYGYARVSDEDQNLHLQLDALRAAKCARIFEDQGVSAGLQSRPGLDALLACVMAGDTVVVWKLDRAFRSVKHALDTVEVLERFGVKLHSLTDPFDKSTPHGTFEYHLRIALAELERSLAAERTRAGMRAARDRGKHVGRPRLLKPEAVNAARSALERPGSCRKTLAASLGVSEQTLRRALRQPSSAVQPIKMGVA